MGDPKKNFIRNDCLKTKEKTPDIYVPKLKETFKDKMLRKVETQTRYSPGHLPEKVIMMVGATGAGKTLLINEIFNYVVGVEWNDKFRLRLIEEETGGNQAVSQTRCITAYTLKRKPGFKVPYTLKVIDTPGFGDTGGIERDKEITEMIKCFFSAKGEGGIDRLDAVGFVIRAREQRLTPTQVYIFDSILKLFGKDFEKNIFMLFTFAEGSKPQAINAVKAANMPFQKYFKFNNMALYESSSGDDEESSFNRMYWNMGMESCSKMISELGNMQPCSLTLTKEVLKERSDLEAAVEGIKENIEISLHTLDQLRVEEEVLKVHKVDVEKNKDFTYDDTEQVLEKQPTSAGQYAINCTVCNVTCHRFCPCAKQEDIVSCSSMDVNGDCKRCPKKCKWHKHTSNDYRLVFKTVSVQRTLGDLKKNYEEAMGKKMSAEQAIAECKKRIEVINKETLQYVAKAKRCIARLEEIALRPNPRTAVDYVDELVVKEEEEAAPGWRARAFRLKEIRKQAERIESLPGEESALSGEPDEKMPDIDVKLDEKPGFFGLVKRLWSKLF